MVLIEMVSHFYPFLVVSRTHWLNVKSRHVATKDMLDPYAGIYKHFSHPLCLLLVF